MAQAVGKYAANKFLKKQMKGYANKKVDSGQDPYFAMVEDPRKPGKLKKVKKQIPAYIPEQDAMVLASVRKWAYRLDMCLFSFLGIRFGWEAVIGLVPAIGDVIGVMMAYMVMRKASKVEGGLPASVQLHMLINIAIDFTIGIVPFIGDLADAAFKCNTKNLRVLEVYLDKKYKPKSQQRDERDLAGVDREKRRSNRKSGIYMPHDPPPATVFDLEDISDEDDERRNDYAAPAVQEPRPTRAPEDRRGGSGGGGGGGWFSGNKKSGRRQERERGTEMREQRR